LGGAGEDEASEEPGRGERAGEDGAGAEVERGEKGDAGAELPGAEGGRPAGREPRECRRGRGRRRRRRNGLGRRERVRLEGKGVGRVAAKMIGQRREGGEVEMLYTRHVLLDRMWLAMAKEGGHLIGDGRDEEGVRLRRVGVDRARAKVGHVKVNDFPTFGRGGGKRNLISGGGGAETTTAGNHRGWSLGLGAGGGRTWAQT
jgi:hypothetical protein